MNNLMITRVCFVIWCDRALSKTCIHGWAFAEFLLMYGKGHRDLMVLSFLAHCLGFYVWVFSNSGLELLLGPLQLY